MINKIFIKKLNKKYNENIKERSQIISLSNVVLHDSKRVIFSLHRNENKKALLSLNKIEKILQNLEKKFGSRRVSQEGSYRAAVEEYVEAKFFYLILQDCQIDNIKELNLNFDSYLGGICDLTGELVRRAVNQASIGNLKEVERIKNIISDIMAELVQFDMVGYLRTKYDQARASHRKIEQIYYEINLINK